MFFHKSSSRRGVLRRLFRFTFSVLIMTAFVVSLSLGIKALSSLDQQKLGSLIDKVAGKMGISAEVGNVAGVFVQRVTDFSIKPSEKPNGNPEISATSTTREDDKKINDSTRQKVLSIAFVSDIHDDAAGLTSALFKAKENEVRAVFLLGDLTDFGVLDNLISVKKILDDSQLLYYALPGDHDLYKSVGSKNFIEVFGEPNKFVTINDVNFLLLDNSANFTPIGDATMRWFSSEVNKAHFVLLAQPVYQDVISVFSPVMGVVNGEETKEVKAQGELILSIIQEAGSVKATVSGDHHRSSETTDPIRSDLKHFVVGAVSPYRNLQSSRFSIMDVYSDASYELREVLLD